MSFCLYRLAVPAVAALVLVSACNKDVAPTAQSTAALVDDNKSLASPKQPASASKPTPPEDKFSLESIPLSNVALPPFPLLSFPEKLPEAFRQGDRESSFEEAYVIAGSALRKVEGRMLERTVGNAQAELTATAARRNYQQALEAMGAVKVNKVMPIDAELVRKEGGDVEKVLKKLRLPDAGPRFEDRAIATHDVYLIRTAEGNTWVTVTTDTDGLNTFLMIVQEEPLRQSVTALTAESLSTALDTEGHIALYLPFDTDKTTLRPESATVLDEVVKLMMSNRALRLRVEGHTDNSGGASHNQSLSLGRAESVKAALVAKNIDSARLETEGFGAARPVADNGDETGRARNRRVELVRL